MLPRFPDESDALPQFTLDSTQERAPIRVPSRVLTRDPDKTLQQLAADDFELIDDAPAPRSIAPVALDASDLEDIEEEELDLEDDDLELPRRRVPWRGIAIGSALCAGIAAIALFARGTSAADVTAVAATMAKPPPPVVVAPPPPPPPPPVPAKVEPPPPPPPPAPTTGTIITPQWAKGRRVWIDGKAIPGHAPKVEAVCGKHQVKIGAYSKTHKVDIPCGGEIKVAP